MGELRYYIIGCYHAPNETLTIESSITALMEHPQGSELLVAGGFNADSVQLEREDRDEDITAALAAAGLEDMSSHILL